jgi:hypothetical protein
MRLAARIKLMPRTAHPSITTHHSPVTNHKAFKKHST